MEVVALSFVVPWWDRALLSWNGTWCRRRGCISCRGGSFGRGRLLYVIQFVSVSPKAKF